MQFVALDGEGIDAKYCLLQDSHGGELFDIEGLKTERVFQWLLRRKEELAGLKPCFIGYVTTYDINMILRDLDDNTLKRIFATDDKDFVQWGTYEILYIPRKVFKLRYRTQEGDSFSFTWYDVYTFFGSSFVVACKGFLGEVPPAIVRGKKRRSRFKKSELTSIRKYNQLECIWLVKLCDKLNEIFLSQGLDLRKWHGPGAVAELILGSKGMKIHAEYPVYRGDQCPIGLWEAFDCAYYGGRFENMGIGTFENVYSYDINSAYPYALSQLCILDYGSRWTRKIRPRLEHGPQAVYLVEWNLPRDNLFGPFPWRDSQKRIFYPLNGLGWYWLPEVAAALDNPRWKRYIKLWEVWYQNTGAPSVLQREIPRLYTLRQRLKKEGNPGEYAIKIALNSAYGKFAQRVGRAPFRCIPWAGWITSHTRSILLRASMGREETILSFATDAIFSRTKLPLRLSGNLGDWKEEHAEKFLILMNGFYKLDDKTRQLKSATRGLPPLKDIKEKDDDVTWNEIIAGLNKEQAFTYQFTQFVTHSLAIHFPNKYTPDTRLRFIKMSKTLSPFANTRREFSTYALRDWESEKVLSKPVKFPSNNLSYPNSLPYASVDIEEEEKNV